MMIAPTREWVVHHLPWIVLGLLALWVPPVVFAVAVDVGIVAGRDYPRLTDPVLVLPSIELALLAIAVPGLIRRSLSAWTLLAWSRGVVLVQALWGIAVDARLSGVRNALTTRTAIEAIAGLIFAAWLLVFIRPAYVITGVGASRDKGFPRRSGTV